MTANNKNETGPVWEQKLAIYHPNNKGTGAALQLEPRLNRSHTDRYNCFFLDMAAQKSTGETRDGKRVPATFDWEHKLTVKLDFQDICELLAVMEGVQQQAGGKRNGLFHANGSGSTVITFQKNSENGGYYLGLSRKNNTSPDAVRIGTTLNAVEAVGLRNILQTGMFFVLFHAHMLTGTGT